jgi:crotonobetaine/carnitine-CoA ligase
VSRDAASLRDLIERRGRDNRHDPFCVFEDTVVTSGMLDAAVNRVANGLGSIGVGPGDRVAVMLPNHPDHIYTLLALVKLGATHVPVNVHLKDAGLRCLLEDAEVRAVVADRRYHDEMAAALASSKRIETVAWRGGMPADGSGKARTFEEVSGGADHPPKATPDPDHVVAIMYTSGSTGPPKGVMLTDRMYQAAGRTAGLVADVRDGDVLFVWEPFYHIAGVQAVTLCLQRGVSCALVERFSASAFWNQVRRHGATQIHYLGGVLGLLMKQPARPDDAQNPVRVAWGAAAPVELWPRFEQRFSVRLHECYGLTEGASFTTVNLAGKVGSIGRPVDHFEVRIVDDGDRPLPPGQVGEIVQREREPGLLMKGYFNNPDATRAALRDGWLHTGDLGYCDAEGFYYFAGRQKERIRRRAENVSAWEIERVMSACPGVEECAVIGVPSDLGEDDIKVFVRRIEGRSLAPLDVIRWCEERLAYFQVPRYVAFVDEFPKTPSERIRKDELPRSVDDCWDREASVPPIPPGLTGGAS